MDKKTILQSLKDIGSYIMGEKTELKTEVVEETVEVKEEVKLEEVIEDEVVEDVMEAVTMEMYNDLMGKVDQMLADQDEATKEKDLELSKVKEENVKLQKTIDETPDAVTIKNNPPVQLKQEPAADAKGRLYQFLNNKQNG